MPWWSSARCRARPHSRPESPLLRPTPTPSPFAAPRHHSYIHVTANVLALTAEHSPLRDCPAVSLETFLVAIGLLVSTVFSMIYRGTYGPTLWLEVVGAALGICGGSLLQMSAKADGFVATANSRDECSVLVFIPAFQAWLIGEAASFGGGVVLFLSWRRDPPFNLPRIPVLVALVGSAVALYFLASLSIGPALGRFFATNSTDV